MVELLSPAGNIDKLKTAFSFGADAAYVGLKDFSLRTRADNFSEDNFEEIRKIKEKNGKKVYLALNALLSEDQIEKIKSMKEVLSSFPCDAFIISDLGLVDFLKNNFPERELHLSTQCSCLNSESALLYKKLGFDRIIMARETSLSDIKRIKDKVGDDITIEAFVHGAMCMSYSGRCLLSSFFTSRSANKGDCSHTCRWNYKLYAEEEERKGIYFPIEENGNYTTILSSKDLCMFDYLDEMKDAGVESFKIEGRMKSLYYVALTTRAYRNALDKSPDYEKYKEDLYSFSHREYTTGFYFSNYPIEERVDDVSKPTSFSYERKYTFLGTIGEKIDDDTWEIKCKNKVSNNDKIELITPTLQSKSLLCYTLLDENLKEVDFLNHEKKGYIKTKEKLSCGDILRKENKGDEVYL